MKRSLYGVVAFLMFLVPSTGSGADEAIGKIVALRGNAVIERDRKALEAKLKDGILLVDTVSTREASKTKMLFIDDSILTVGENTRLVIKEFVLGKEDRGRAIFNLLDGKMRSVVGKTNFEVHTPTAVAAARGTVIYFEVGMEGGKKYTLVISLDGEVLITSADPTISGRVVLTPGMMINVKHSEALPAPAPAPEGAIQAAAMSGEPARAKADSLLDIEALKATLFAPNIQQLPVLKGSVPVNVGIAFPD
jgi:hypothetical protein